jgi:hypothetical protein
VGFLKGRAVNQVSQFDESLPLDESPPLSETLPRRDWLLLPLVVLSVVALFIGVSEFAANRLFPESGRFTCTTRDRFGLLRQKPNCVCSYKNAEGPLVEYRFNECGYRSTKSCGTKPHNTLRVVVMGAPLTMGLFIPGDETFVARTEAALNRICGHPVELQNMGSPVRFFDEPKLASEALGLSPDVIVLPVSPYDLENLAANAQPSDRRPRGRAERIRLAWHDLVLKTRESKFFFAAQHFMLLDTHFLYEAYQNSGGSREVLIAFSIKVYS